MTTPHCCSLRHATARRRRPRAGFTAFTALGWALAALIAGGAPHPAGATPVLVTFDGPFFENPAPRNFGIGDDSVAAALAADVPLVRLDFRQVGPALDPGPITIDQDLQNATDPEVAPVEALSTWTGESSVSFADGYFLVFAAVEPTVPEASGPYSGPEVSLGIDAELGWVLVQVGSLVFPSMLLEDLDAEEAFIFDVAYLIDRTLPVASDEMGEDAFFLPQFRLVGADVSAVIPEPSTALLVGLGVLALAIRRRHRA